MNNAALVALGQNAGAWAKAYVATKTALMKEGVPEDEARDEARYIASYTSHWPEHENDGEPCPLCGQPSDE